MGFTAGGAAPGDGFNCGGCIDKKDIGKNAVGTDELVNGSVKPGDLAANAKTRVWSVENNTGFVDVTDGTQTEMISMNITVPAAGFLYIHGQATLNNNDDSNIIVTTELQLDGTDITPPGESRLGPDGGGFDVDLATPHIVVPVTKGAHTVSFDVDPPAVDVQTVRCYDQVLTAIFFPQGKVFPEFVPA